MSRKKKEKYYDTAKCLPRLIEGDDGEWFCRPIVIVGDKRFFESAVYISISNTNFDNGKRPNIIVLVDYVEDHMARSEVLSQYCTLSKELTEALDESKVYEVGHETKLYRKEAFSDEDWKHCILTLLTEEW